MAGIAQLKAIVGLDTKAYKAGTRDVKDANASLLGSFKTIGAAIGITFGVASIIRAAGAIRKWADDTSTAAQNVGILTSEMIALNRVAIQGGLGVDQMAMMLGKLQNKLGDAAKGDKTAAAAFDDLGLSVSDLIKMDPTTMLQTVAKAAIATGTPIETLSNLFGEKLGPKAVTALRQIADEGLPAVDAAIGQTADAIEALGDRYAVAIDGMKQLTLEWLAAFQNGLDEITDFWGGFIAGGEGGRMQAGSDAMQRGETDRQKRLDEMTKKREAEQKAAIEERGRLYMKNLEDQIAKEEKLMADQMQSAVDRAKVGAPEVSSMEKMGAAFGGARPELRMVERQIQIAADQLVVAREHSTKLSELKDALDRFQGGL
jgi:hypothetical protein